MTNANDPTRPTDPLADAAARMAANVAAGILAQTDLRHALDAVLADGRHTPADTARAVRALLDAAGAADTDDADRVEGDDR